MSSIKKPNKELADKLAEKFESPDEFVYLYNAYLMGRLSGKGKENEDLESWFESMNEDELDEANLYYLTNERVKKFAKELQSIRRKCNTRAKKLAFNTLLESFCDDINKTYTLNCVKSYCTTKDQRRAFNMLVKTFGKFGRWKVQGRRVDKADEDGRSLWETIESGFKSKEEARAALTEIENKNAAHDNPSEDIEYDNFRIVGY